MRSVLSTLIAFAFFVCALSAGAQSEADKERAAKLFEEGKALMEEKKYEQACEKFQSSYDLSRGVGAQYFLARCLTERGRTATAYRHFKEVAEISLRVGQQDRADVAKERIKELEPRLMKIRVEVPTPVPGLEVACDGKPLPEHQWGIALPYDPGTHYVTASAPGAAGWEQRIELSAEGTVTDIQVPALGTGAAADDDDDDDGPGGPESDSSTALLASGIAIGGLGVIGLAVGGGMAGVAKSTYDDSDEFCDDTGCDQPGLDLVEDARSLGNGATAMFIVGGVLLAGGATLVILGALQDDETGWIPSIRVAPTAASFRWRF